MTANEIILVAVVVGLALRFVTHIGGNQMRKREELTNPNSCMSRARDDEFTFVLLARDEATPDTIRFWAAKRIEKGKNRPGDPQIVEALAAADTIEAEQKNKGGNPCPTTTKEQSAG